MAVTNPVLLDGLRWISKRHRDRNDVVQLTGVPLTLPLSAIYDRIELRDAF